MTIIVQVILPDNCCQGLKAHPLSGATSTYIKFTVVALVCSQTYWLLLLQWKVCLVKMRSLANTVHQMTDQDSSLGSCFIVSNITKADEIP